MSDGQAGDNVRRQTVPSESKRKQIIPTFQRLVPLITKIRTHASGRLILSRNTFFYQPASVQLGFMARCSCAGRDRAWRDQAGRYYALELSLMS